MSYLYGLFLIFCFPAYSAITGYLLNFLTYKFAAINIPLMSFQNTLIVSSKDVLLALKLDASDVMFEA